MNARRAAVSFLLAPCLAACARAVVPPDPLTGVVVQTMPQSGSFVVRDGNGDRFTFELDDPLATLTHLDVHRRDGFPVIVTFRADGGVLHATHVADRYPSPSPSPS